VDGAAEVEQLFRGAAAGFFLLIPGTGQGAIEDAASFRRQQQDNLRLELVKRAARIHDLGVVIVVISGPDIAGHAAQHFGEVFDEVNQRPQVCPPDHGDSARRLLLLQYALGEGAAAQRAQLEDLRELLREPGSGFQFSCERGIGQVEAFLQGIHLHGGRHLR
jgi:hypothetical protein